MTRTILAVVAAAFAAFSLSAQIKYAEVGGVKVGLLSNTGRAVVYQKSAAGVATYRFRNIPAGSLYELKEWLLLDGKPAKWPSPGAAKVPFTPKGAKTAQSEYTPVYAFDFSAYSDNTIAGIIYMLSNRGATCGGARAKLKDLPSEEEPDSGGSNASSNSKKRPKAKPEPLPDPSVDTDGDGVSPLDWANRFIKEYNETGYAKTPEAPKDPKDKKSQEDEWRGWSMANRWINEHKRGQPTKEAPETGDGPEYELDVSQEFYERASKLLDNATWGNSSQIGKDGADPFGNPVPGDDK